MHRLLKIASGVFLVLFLLSGPLGAVCDVGTTQIAFPNGGIPYRQWMLPLNVRAQAMVRNFGDSAASFHEGSGDILPRHRASWEDCKR